MDVATYSLLNKKIKGLTSGIQGASISGTTITFTMADGSKEVMTFPTPADGVSITDVNVNTDKHLIVTLSDGSTVDAGLVPTVKGDKGEQGEKGDTGFSPTITENPDNTNEIYKLDVTNEGGTFTTPNLKGTGGGLDPDKYYDKTQVDTLIEPLDEAKHTHDNKDTVLDKLTTDDAGDTLLFNGNAIKGSVEIDDTTVEATDKVWSAKKTNDTFEEVKQSVNDIDAKFDNYDTSDEVDGKIATALVDYAKATDITNKADKLTDTDVKENQILLDDGNGNIKASGKDISEYIPAWSGTKAEWEALDKSTLADGAVVNITDDFVENPVQVKAMPDTATEGDVVQYIGFSTTDYTHGYFYEYAVNETGILSWKYLPVDAVGALIDDTATDVTDKTWSVNKIRSSTVPYVLIDTTKDIDFDEYVETGYYTPNKSFSTGWFTHSILHAPTEGWLPAGGFALEVKTFDNTSSSKWFTQVLYSYVGTDNNSAPIYSRTFFYDGSESIFSPWKRIADIDDTKVSENETWSSKKINDTVGGRMEFVCAEYKTEVSDANTYVSYQAKGKCRLICDYANITRGDAAQYVFVYIGNYKLPEGTGIYKINIPSAQTVEINIEQNVIGKLTIYADYNV